MIDCHYRRLGADGEFQCFESTDYTRSNWDPEIQHGSPPLALMTKLIEELSESTAIHDRASAGCRWTSSARFPLRRCGFGPGWNVRAAASHCWRPRCWPPVPAVPTVPSPARRRGCWRTSDTADVATDRYPAARRRRGRAGAAQLGGRDRLPGGHQLAQAARTRQRVAGGVVEPARAPGRRRGDDADCSAWHWWSTAPTAPARRSIPTSSCS